MTVDELLEVLKNLNISITGRDLASLWGMSEENVSRMKNGKKQVKAKYLELLEKEFDISLIKHLTLAEHLMQGSGKNFFPFHSLNMVEVTYLPDVYLSAGYGVENYNENKQKMLIDTILLTSEKGLKINPDNCEIVRISGNSMFPEYRHGDRVIIDRGDTTLSDGHIYAFRYKNECYVKEINLMGDRIKCISLNKDYDPFYINKDEDFVVFGKILPRIRL